MQLHEFIGRVQERAHLQDKDQALAVTQATLTTLCERLFGEEPRHLGAQLPDPLGEWLDRQGAGERFSASEFCQRVADRAHVAKRQAEEQTRAVLQTLTDAVSEGEIQDVLGQLPHDYDRLFGSGIERRH